MQQRNAYGKIVGNAFYHTNHTFGRNDAHVGFHSVNAADVQRYIIIRLIHRVVDYLGGNVSVHLFVGGIGINPFGVNLVFVSQ